MKRAPTQIRRSRSRESGVALILALLFITLLTVLVADYSYEMKVDALLISSQNSEMEAYLAAKSGIATAMGTLAADLLTGEQDSTSQSGGIFDSLDEHWASEPELSSTNEAVGAYRITDEYGKLNINALLFDTAEQEDVEYTPLIEALQYIFELREVENFPVDAILDWLDHDDEVRPEGYERDYYENLTTAYGCRNGPMDSIEELLLIPGITPEVYYGDPELEQLPLSELLTVHGHPEGRVNINTADLDVLEALFAVGGRVGDAVSAAEDVFNRVREEDPFLSIDDLQQAQYVDFSPRPENPDPNEEAPEPLPNLFDVSSATFRIQSDGQAGDASLRIEAYIWRDTPDSNTGDVVGDSQMFRILDWQIIR